MKIQATKEGEEYTQRLVRNKLVHVIWNFEAAPLLPAHTPSIAASSESEVSRSQMIFLYGAIWPDVFLSCCLLFLAHLFVHAD